MKPREKALLKWVREVALILDIQWNIRFDAEEVEDGSTIKNFLEIEPDNAIPEATLRVHPRFWNQEPKEQLFMLLHELHHCIASDADDAATAGFSAIEEEKALAQAKDRYDHAAERAAWAFARAVISFFKPRRLPK